MLKQTFFVLAAVVLGLPSGMGDTIQLKDKAAVTGKILADKHDQVVVDVGYTVLVVPRNQIVKVSKSDVAEPVVSTSGTKKNPLPAAIKAVEDVVTPGFYTTSAKSGPTRPVRELVGLLGES